MTTRRIFLLQTLGITGAALLGAGCGGGDSQPDPSTPSPSPSASTPPTSGAGDFGFVLPERNVSRNVVLDASGAGSYAMVLRSVQGFNRPITFPTEPLNARNADGDAISAEGITISFDPASLPSLPAGDTPVTLRVQGAGALAAASYVEVDFHAEGDGLSRYLTIGTDRNNSRTRFYKPGFIFQPETSVDLVVGNTSSPRYFYGTLQSIGEVGTLEVRVLDLPENLSADPFTTALTEIYDDGFNIPIIVNGTPQAGTYTVRLVASINGTVRETHTATLTIARSTPPATPKLSTSFSSALTVRRGQSVTVPGKVTATLFSGDVAFSAGTLPPGMTLAATPATLPVIADQPRDFTLTVTADANTPLGEQRVNLVAKFGGYEVIFNLSFTVEDSLQAY